MADLLAARSQMAISLMFHILFAIAGMAMPVLMVVSEALWLQGGHGLEVVEDLGGQARDVDRVCPR